MPINPIALGLSSSPNRNDNQAILTNCYAEDVGQSNQSQWVVYACSGYQSFATLGGNSGAQRGMLGFDDNAIYTVSGTGIFKVTSGGVATEIGTIPSASTTAYMARNRKDPNAQVAIVTTDGNFRLIENDVVTTPSVDVDVGAELFNSVCGMDGYFIFTKSNGEWYISQIDDATIDDLEFAQANTKPDGLTRGIVRGRDLLIMGPQSVEAYQNTGQEDFTFERAATIGVGISHGPAALNCMAITEGGMADVVIFPANNPDGSYLGVVLLDGYNAKTISPFALDRAILAEPVQTSIRAFMTTDNGHTFYNIWGSTFSWAFDCTTGLWHVRKSSASSIWNVSCAATMGGRQILAHPTSGALYRLDTTPQTPSSSSTVAMRHSNDNGETWKGPRTRNVGTSKTQRLRWFSLGESSEDGKVFEFTLSNAFVESGTGVSASIITPPVQSFPSAMVFNAVFMNLTTGTSQTNSYKGFYSLACDAESKKP